jgi:hypothetical protein
MRTRALLVITGITIMAYAVPGVLAHPGVPLFLAGVLVAHDAVWMVAVLAAGAAVRRFVPERHRSAVSIGAISAAAVTVVGFPLVTGFGRAADNPSVLPLPYGRNLAAVLVAVAAATILTRLLAYACRKNFERPGRDDPEAADR